MKIFVASLNWGLGHASRCVPIIRRYLCAEHEVVIGSDGAALDFLKTYFPNLRTIELPHLDLHYSAGKSQVATLVSQLPHIIKWIQKDGEVLERLIEKEHFDVVVSDNRFGLCPKKQINRPYMVYITHQLHIILPRLWRWLEPLAEWWHRRIIELYDECWVPDNEDINVSLGGDLSHPIRLPQNIKYIGPLSRFESYPLVNKTKIEKGRVVAVISGLEPQRTLFEKWVRSHYSNNDLIVVDGKSPYPSDDELYDLFSRAEKIVSRSGYSSIMDYAVLDVLSKAELYPTPGQSEQEYLARLCSF